MICKNLVVNTLENAATSNNSIANFLQLASQFDSKIDISVGQKKVNAKSLMGMLAIGVTPGEKIGVMVDGSDEQEAMRCIEQFLKN